MSEKPIKWRPRVPWVESVLVVVALLFCLGPITAETDEPELDWAGLAGTIVKSLSLQAGEKVLLLNQPGVFEPLVAQLRQAIVKAGAVDLGSPAQNEEELAVVDVSVVLPGYQGGLDQRLKVYLTAGKGRMIHFHWSGEFPAPGHPLPSRGAINMHRQTAILETDYRALSAIQKRFEAALRTGEVHVTTPAGTDLRFQVGDRPVSRGDGDASLKRMEEARVLIDREVELPAGAIRVAPWEKSVRGTIVFPPSEWSGKEVVGLKLRFEKGKVIHMGADSDLEAAEQELDGGGAAARGFREFALGFNPLLQVPENSPWIPNYGYGAGVVRLSLGDNTELGGEVRGGYVRWNFFVDATVTVNGKTWVKNGKLTPPGA